MLIPGCINGSVACPGLAVPLWLLRPHGLSRFATPAADMQLPGTTQEWIILPQAGQEADGPPPRPQAPDTPCALYILAPQKEGLAAWLSGLQGPVLSLEVSLGGEGMAAAHFPRSQHRAALPPSAGVVFSFHSSDATQTLSLLCMSVNFNLI